MSMSQNVLKHHVQTRFLKSLYSYNDHAEVQTRMAEELLESLRRLNITRFNSVFEIGCGTGLLTERFLKSFHTTTFYANDLVEECGEVVSDIFRQYPQGNFQFIGGDIEGIEPLPGQFDLLISNATFQWLNDLRIFLSKIHRYLKTGGILAFSTFGPQNLYEIRALTGNSLTYLPYNEIYSLLQELFHVIRCSEEQMTLHFSSPRQVLSHLRLTGVNGLSKQQWTKSDLQAFERRYYDCFGEHHQVPLTYHPILCVVKNT